MRRLLLAENEPTLWKLLRFPRQTWHFGYVQQTATQQQHFAILHHFGTHILDGSSVRCVWVLNIKLFIQPLLCLFNLSQTIDTRQSRSEENRTGGDEERISTSGDFNHPQWRVQSGSSQIRIGIVPKRNDRRYHGN